MGLTGFLEERLAEDEAAAKLAAQHGADWTQIDPDREAGRIESAKDVVTYDEGSPSGARRAHIARHDPARVLREVAAKRERLAAYVAAKAEMPHDDDIGYEFGPGVRAGTTDALELEVRRDAAIYSDHPDYDPALPA